MGLPAVMCSADREDTGGRGDQRGPHVGTRAAGVLPVTACPQLGPRAAAATETGGAEGIRKAVS